jgi:hypothetical protein
MNAQAFNQMVNEAVARELKALAATEARRIVAGLTGAPKPAAQAATTPRVRVRRDRKSARRQYAPKGCWIALGRAQGTPQPTGRLAEAYTVARDALAAGPAERSVVTRIMTEARPGWTPVVASGCISRLVARGRLAVVGEPRQAA